MKKPFDPETGDGTPQTDSDFAVWSGEWGDDGFGVACQCGATGLATLRESVAAGWTQHGWLDFPSWRCPACSPKADEPSDRGEVDPHD